jgi:thioredoxin 1
MALFKKRTKPIALESVAHLEELARSGRPVFVDFFQYGCSPCQVMDGIVNELASEFGDSAHIVKANAANVPQAFDRFNVKSTPTFMVLTSSVGAASITQRWRASGLVKKDVLVKTLTSAGATTIPNG